MILGPGLGKDDLRLHRVHDECLSGLRDAPVDSRRPVRVGGLQCEPGASWRSSQHSVLVRCMSRLSSFEIKS